MPNTSLGRVSIVPRGAYDPAATYDRLDAVAYAGDSWLVLQSGVTGVTPAEGEHYTLLAKGGQPAVREISGAEVTLTLANSVEYRCADPVTALTIDGFAPGDDGKAEQWGLVFTAGETITVTVPDTLIWAVAEPVFSAGSTYWLSVVPLGEKYLAAWTEVLADGSQTA